MPPNNKQKKLDAEQAKISENLAVEKSDTTTIKEIESNEIKLLKKILATQSDIGSIPKNGYNKHQSYHYAKWEDIIKEVRTSAIGNGLLISVEPLNKSATKEDKTTTVEMSLKIDLIDVDTAHTKSYTYFGTGSDFSDKSIYKAYTGTIKYAMIDIFLVPIGDDPEESESENKNGFELMQKQVKESNGKIKTLTESLNKSSEFVKTSNELVRSVKLNILNAIPKDLQVDLKSKYPEADKMLDFIISNKFNWGSIAELLTVKNQTNKNTSSLVDPVATIKDTAKAVEPELKDPMSIDENSK